MPKKFAGENSKAVIARARKAATKEEEKRIREKAKEDEYWKDDDKSVVKKQQRKDEKEKKKQEQLEKKQEAKLLLDKEMDSIKVVGKLQQQKLTRSEILAETANKNTRTLNNKTNVEQEDLLIENVNRLVVDGEEARTVQEAIQILGPKEKQIDKHPERRIKAAYAAFEAQNLERLKAENPTLRLSQVKLLLRKEWMKSPSNPINNL